MIFHQLAIGGFDNNFTYCLGDEKSREVFLVDPDNYDYLIDFLNKENLKLKGIILTHGHFDHVGISNKLSRIFKVPIYMDFADKIVLESKLDNMIDFKSDKFFKIGDEKITIIHTPGHTPGSICLYFDNKLITGDTLFVGGIGRTDFAYSDENLMKDSLTKLGELPDNTEIWPGHDYGSKKYSTLKFEKDNNLCLVNLLS